MTRIQTPANPPPAAPQASAATAGRAGALDRPPGFRQLHPDVSVNYELNRWLSAMTPQAAADVAKAAAQVRDHEQFISEFLALGEALLRQGRRLDAAFCFRAADFYIPAGDPRKAPARARFLELARQAHAIRPDQYAAVAYQGGTLPACRMGQARRGTVLITGGFDSYLEERFAMMSAISQAGYQVITFDGPGQGGALEDGGMTLTPDWDRPVSAVLDHFGLDRVTIVGMSLGGCLALRAAAREPRVTRVVADDVLTDLAECTLRQLPALPRRLAPAMLRLRASRPLDTLIRRRMHRDLITAWGVRQGQHVLGVPTPHGYLRSAARFITADISPRVRADVLLLAGAKDHYVPLHQLTDQIRTLTSARSVTARVFTEHEQADQHCHWGNPALAIQVILDWLDTTDLRDDRLTPPRPG